MTLILHAYESKAPNFSHWSSVFQDDCTEPLFWHWSDYEPLLDLGMNKQTRDEVTQIDFRTY